MGKVLEKQFCLGGKDTGISNNSYDGAYTLGKNSRSPIETEWKGNELKKFTHNIKCKILPQ